MHEEVGLGPKGDFQAFPLGNKEAHVLPLLKLEILEEKDRHLLSSIVLISTSFFNSSGLPLLDPLSDLFFLFEICSFIYY